MNRSTTSRAIARRDPIADEVREEIRTKAEAARWRHRWVASMLHVIEEHLFEPDLTAETVMRRAGLRDRSVVARFHQVVGLPPGRYITHVRARIAERLLLETDLEVQHIGKALGFSNIHVFSRAFMRFTGVRPLHFREGRRVPLDDLEFAYRAIAGELVPSEASRLLRHLVETYVEQRGVDVPGAETVHGPPDGPASA